MVICLERVADLHMAQLMPLPLTVSCFSEIHIGFTFLVPAHPGSPGKSKVKVKKSKQSIAVSDSPHRYGNSHATWDHTVLPATRQK